MEGVAPELEVKGVEISLGELLQLCAADSELFAKTFFPKTVRVPSPPMSQRMWEQLENPEARYLNLIAPRGFAKTSRLRLFTAKRIAYAMSHTILYVGASEPHASRSIMWLRSAIASTDPNTGALVQTKFARAFGLRPGRKWNETDIEIYHGVDQRPIWIIGAGITGNVRGINFEDYRPDLIILDDILTDENTATPDQRTKIEDLVFNSLKESLAPEVEEPNAKLVLLNTPHHPEDVSAKASYDPTFVTERFSCWTKETVDLPIEQQESAWPELKPSVTLRKEKSAAIQTNRYSGWARENECKLVTSERAAFRGEWLNVRTGPPPSMFCVISIDPVPPPSDLQLAKGLQTKDFEAITVVGRKKGEYHLLDYKKNRGHNPDWTMATVFTFVRMYRPARLVIQGIAYERVLKWILEKEMQRRQIFVPVNTLKGDRRSKYNRIISSITEIASSGRLWIGPKMDDFRAQFSTYPAIPNEDLLEAVALGLSDLVSPYLEGEIELDELDEYIEEIEPLRACP